MSNPYDVKEVVKCRFVFWIVHFVFDCTQIECIHNAESRLIKVFVAKLFELMNKNWKKKTENINWNFDWEMSKFGFQTITLSSSKSRFVACLNSMFICWTSTFLKRIYLFAYIKWLFWIGRVHVFHIRPSIWRIEYETIMIIKFFFLDIHEL